MRRIKNISAICMIVFLIVGLTACGSSKTTTGGSSTAADSSTQSSSSSSVKKTAESSYTMGETVIVDNESCTFTVKSIELDDVWGFTLNVLCENKTDKNVMFSWDSVSVNGYMLDPFWATSVTAGNKANSTISFYDTDLADCGISTVDEITFMLSVYDMDDYSAPYILEEQYSIYPTGLDASTVKYPDRITKTGENTVIDDDNITFIILGDTTDGDYAYTLNCYIKNKTDKNLTFSMDDVSVNGFMIDPLCVETIAAGKSVYMDVNFADVDFEANSVTKVEKIDYTVTVYNSDDWSEDYLINSAFSYTPQAAQ